MSALSERLERESTPEPMSGCMLWFGHSHRQGYGHVRWNGRMQLTHRLALEASGVEVPKSAKVLHSCDTPACINPAHLRVGTQADNAADRERRHRRVAPRGNACHQAKLTPDAVVAARQDYARGLRLAELAARCGVGQSSMWAALRGHSWREVGGPLA